MNYSSKLANRTQSMKPGMISELLRAASDPSIISLAAGNPAPESFPIEIIKELSQTVVDKYGPGLFQYGVSAGFMPLREALKSYLQKIKGIETDVNQIGVTSGAQSAIDAVAKVFIEKGDVIAVESPTFLAAFKTFDCYEANYVAIEIDENGVVPESLEAVIKNHNPKFIYLIPNFQNPTGYTLSLERRYKIAEIIKKYGALIVEDDPYFELRYSGDNLPTLYSLAPENVIYIASFSKILAPGVRLGYFVAPSEIYPLLVSAVLTVIVHSDNYAQAIAAEYISEGHLQNHLPKILDIYKPRLDNMLYSLEKYFPKELEYSKPEGGMFVWINGPEKYDFTQIYKKAIENKVAYVPGEPFFMPNTKWARSTMRLNFTSLNEEKIEEGIKLLAQCL